MPIKTCRRSFVRSMPMASSSCLPDVTNAAVVLLLGLLLHRFTVSLVFVVTLCSVRNFSGGFHAKTFHACRLSMLLTFFITLGAFELLVRCQTYLNGALLILLALLGVANTGMMVLLAPCRIPIKRWIPSRKQKTKQKAVILTAALSVLSILCTFLGIREGIAIAVTLTAVSVLMPIGRKNQKGGRKNVWTIIWRACKSSAWFGYQFGKCCISGNDASACRAGKLTGSCSKIPVIYSKKASK